MLFKGLFAFTLIVIVTFTHAAGYVAEVEAPRFSYLSTSNGLAQNSVHALHVDDQGFLWLGTEEGLNRFDGHRTTLVQGQNGELLGNAIYAISQDSKQRLWLATALSGVLTLDLTSGKVQSQIDLPMMQDEEWMQYAVSFQHISERQLLIGFNEQVVLFDKQDGSYETVFSLDANDLKESHGVRYALQIDGITLVASTNGLYASSENNEDFVSLNYLPLAQQNANNQNAKYLFAQGAYVWLGTVEGLYRLSLANIKDVLEKPENKRLDAQIIDPNRNVWSIRAATKDMFYVGTDRGLFRAFTTTKQFDYILAPRKPYEDIPRKAIKSIALDQGQNLWLGTETNGALFWSPKSLAFTNVVNKDNTPLTKRINHNSIWSIHEDGDALWLGTSNGLTRYDMDTQLTQQYKKNDDEKANLLTTEISKILPADDAHLWLHSGDGIKLFNKTSGDYVDIPFADADSAALFAEYSWGLAKNDQQVFGLSDDGIIMLDTDTFQASLFEPESVGVNIALIQGIITYDEHSKLLILSASGRLYGFDPVQQSMTELHNVLDQKISVDVYPTAFLRDSRNRVWVGYGNLGLFALDGVSWQELNHYSTNSQLGTNMQFGLQEDRHGHIWYGSHKGLYQFNPDTLVSSRYSYQQGLASTEFNQGASARLSAGRFVFGAINGFTIFDPEQVSALMNTQMVSPSITAVAVGARDLGETLRTLNDRTIDLKHDDLGLSIYFSSLNFERMATELYQYRLTSEKGVSVYPVTLSNVAELSNLSGGQYVFELLNIATDSKEVAQTLYINVEYPPFLSPQAKVVYVLLAILLLGLYLLRRYQLQLIITRKSRELRIYNQRLTGALQATNSDIWEYDSLSNTITAARYKTILADCQSDQLNFNQHLAHIHPSDKLHYLEAWQEFVQAKGDKTLDLTYRIQGKNEEVHWFRDLGRLSRKAEQNKYRIIGTYTNVTESVANEQRLKLFGDAFEHTRDWVLIFDEKQQALAANNSFLRAFGLTSASKEIELDEVLQNQHEIKTRVIGRLASVKSDQRWKEEIDFYLQDRQVTALMDINCISDQHDPDVVDYYLVIMTDISEQKNAQKALERLASFDELTGLINRTLLLDRLNHSIANAKRHKTGLSVLFIDLDRFKPINDTFGHDVGDKVLVKIAERIQSSFREQDTVARLGGDEFVVVLEDISEPDIVLPMVTALLAQIEQPISVNHQPLSVSASIGVSTYPNNGDDAEQLLRNADIAMYYAKESGKNNCQFFTTDMNEVVEQEMLLANRVKGTVKNKQFRNFYQPIIDIKTNMIMGFEMLMRWPLGTEMVPPSTFIPIAEQLGLIVEVTMDAICQAIEDAAVWHRQGFDGYIAINLSAKHFNTRPQFEEILRLLAAKKLPTSCLRFEITEGLFINNNANTLDYMNEMRALGFKISLDDFGTGYSSLRYLKDFPIDVVKIDKSFVDDIGLDSATESIIRSTLTMAENLGMDTVAEGIETPEQVAFFVQTSCRYLQGYFFTKPLPAEDIKRIIMNDDFSVSVNLLDTSSS